MGTEFNHRKLQMLAMANGMIKNLNYNAGFRT